MQHIKSSQKTGSTPDRAPLGETGWESARRATLTHMQPQLTGKHWVQLSQQAKPLIKRATPESGSLWVEVIDASQNTSPNHVMNRLTSFSSKSADGIICDQLIQTHPQPERILKEIQQVLRPGGWVLICGAGSLRGKQAAGIHSSCIRPQKVAEILAHGNLKLIQCQTHANNLAQSAWQQRIEQWRISYRSEVARHLPSLLPFMCNHANTRPGWVMLFRDQTLGMTPLASPLKSRAIKLQANSAISLCKYHGHSDRPIGDNQRSNTSTFTTRAA